MGLDLYYHNFIEDNNMRTDFFLKKKNQTQHVLKMKEADTGEIAPRI